MSDINAVAFHKHTVAFHNVFFKIEASVNMIGYCYESSCTKNVYRSRFQDALVDDEHIYATLDFSSKSDQKIAGKEEKKLISAKKEKKVKKQASVLLSSTIRSTLYVLLEEAHLPRRSSIRMSWGTPEMNFCCIQPTFGSTAA